MTAPDLSRLRIDRDAVPEVRSGFRRNLILFVVIAGIIAAVSLIWGRGRAVPVQAVVVSAPTAGSAATAATAVTANGYVVARTKASVASKVPGRLEYLGVAEGSRVRKGQVIARLEHADYAAAVAQAEAEQSRAQASMGEAVATRNQLRRDSVRSADLLGRNLISAAEVEQINANLEGAEARVRVQRALIAAADAALAVARANLENTNIRAPFDGTVLRKDAEVGEVVAPSVGGGLTRGAVVTMADLSSLEVEVDVNEAYIARVRKSQPARITLDAYPDTGFRGAVRQVVPTADRQRATVQVKVTILDRDPRILPEMGARVDFQEEARPDVASAVPAGPLRFRLPASAVRDEGGQAIVWLIRDGRLEQRQVDAGPVSGGFREIRSGLSGGEQVLTGGVESPRAGMKVEVTN